ncbi:PepSY domain-containing protein [Sphingosinicella sp. CPCC 101087]|uniref:PepSY domain-containing protein n=1 Tax=Sphingosinicella sp. CPCC 101087 TaxID=2497754 RepID=UPI00101B824F|nr:PepSY domain-containing protein [Sphingosinicella sp. CPCC 101087]
MSALWAKIHRWLALLMAIQILFWFVSGLFFAAFPIERVRSEHAIAPAQAEPVPFGTAADGLLRLGSAGVTGERIEIRNLLGRPVALIAAGESRPRLYDLATGQRLSPLPMDAAARIAEADHAGELRASMVERVAENSTEYRGPLPAWRVDFQDRAARSLYVAADTGAVTARRSTLWRVYDFLWGLHVMDWRTHEDFNSPLLVAATLLGLVVVISGLVMLPRRLGYTAWRRRRRARASSGSSIVGSGGQA